MINSSSLLQIFKSSPLSGLLLLPDAPIFTVVEVTGSYLSMFGRKESELLGKGFFEAFIPNSTSKDSPEKQEIRDSFQKVITEKLPQKETWKKNSALLQEGSRSDLYYTVENIPILSDSGQLEYIFHCISDTPVETSVAVPAEKPEGVLSKIMESSLDVICIIDEKGHFVKVSAAAERLWGYPEGDMIGRYYMDFIYEPDHEMTREIGLAIKNGCEVKFFENRIICKDGNPMPLIWSSKWDAEEKLFYSIAKDATESKKAELEMQLMIDNTDEAFVLLDNHLLITAYNMQFYQLYKKSFGKEIKKGNSILEYAISDNNAHLIAIYNEVLKGNTKNYQITLPLPAASPKVFTLKYKPAKNNKDEIVGVFITITDSTEAVLAQQRMEASEEKYRLLFYNSPMPMWIYDIATFKVLDVNDTAVQNYGYSYEEFCSMTILDFRPAQDVHRIIALHLELREKAGRINFGTHRHRKKNGEIIIVEIFGFRIRYDRKDCVVVVSNDITEKEKIFQQLRENEAKLLTAQKIAALGYWQLQLKDKEFFWSDEIYKIWGVSKEDFDVNRESFETIHPDDRALFVRQKDELLYGRGCVDFEHRIILPDGSIKWVHETGEVVKNENGDPVVVEGTVQDVTTRKLLELSLAESNQRYEYVTKATFDAIWDWNLVTDEIFWGEGIHSIFGFDISKLKPDRRSWTDHIHPDDYERILREVNAVINSTESFWSNEYRYKKADGTFAFVLDRGFVIRDNKGKAIRMVGSLQDVTRQKKEEHRLKLLESVVVNTSDGVLILECDSQRKPVPRIIYANEAFCQMTRYTSEELLGKSLELFENAMPDTTESDQFMQAFHNMEAFERTAKVITKTRALLWVNTIFSPVFDGQGEGTQWVAINRNITERKQEETIKTLMAETSQIFNKPDGLDESLQEVLETLRSYWNFSFAEIWLTGFDNNQINLSAFSSTTHEIKEFYKSTASTKSLFIGEGLPGTVWKKKKIQFWKDVGKDEMFLRRKAFDKAGLQSVFGIPLIYNKAVIGVLLLGLSGKDAKDNHFRSLFKSFSPHLSAEIKRKQIEQELNQIFDFSPDIICIAGANGYYKKVNPAMSRMLGYSEEELLSIPMDYFLHPDDKEMTLKRIRNLSLNKTADYMENRLVSKSGEVFWVAWTATSGSEEGTFFCIAKDITEKKNLEHLLSEANRLARIGSWEFDIKKGQLFWSDITKEIHGYDESFTPDPLLATEHCKPGKNKEMLENAVANAIRNASGWDLEIEIITAQGDEKWIRTIGQVEYFNGEPGRIYGSLQDIDARKKAEEEVRKSNEVYTIVSKATNDSIWDWNLVTNEITRPGKKMEMLLGYEDISPLRVDKFFQRLIDPDDKARMTTRLNEVINDPTKDYWEDEYKILKSDGGFISVFDKAYIMRDANGKAIRMIGASQDITKLKENEIQLKALNTQLQKNVKELAASNAELEQFAYIASHDLQEPLRMVTSFLSLIERKYADVVDEKGKQYIYFAVDGAKRMRQIILDLLEFSRVGRTDDDLEEIDVNELLKDIILLFGKQISETNAKIDWKEMPAIKAFKAPLRQVFQNLISNALKYQKPDVHPVIKINFQENKHHWQFSVSDNGIGIDSEYFERIFVIFQRLHNKDEYSGTGIGLAIVKKIVENMGGKIWIVSEEGKGSIFYFTVAK